MPRTLDVCTEEETVGLRINEEEVIEDDKNMNEENETRSWWKNSWENILKFKVEPILFLAFFCNSLVDALCTELILTRTCINKFEFSEENCTGKMSETMKDIVQPYASKVVMAKTLLEALFPALLSLFIGPWMDINGRKPFLISPLCGITITYTVWLGLSYIKSLPPYYFLFASLPVSFSGGFLALQTSAYSYLADTIKEKMRALRMAILGLFIGIGVISGYLVTTELSKIFTINLPLVIYGISMIIMVSNALYTFWAVPESIDVNKDTRGFKMVTSFFKFDHIKQSINLLLTRKPKYGRAIILLLVSAIFFSVIIEQGETVYLYLVTKAHFSWTMKEFNYFRSIMTAVGIGIGTPVLLLLKLKLKLSDLTFLHILSIKTLIASIILLFSTTTLLFYIGKGLGLFTEILRSFSKTKISYTVQPADIGKIFALISTLEAIAPLIASVVYAAVFNAVISTNVLYVFILSVVLSILIYLFIVMVTLIERKHGQNEPTLKK